MLRRSKEIVFFLYNVTLLHQNSNAIAYVYVLLQSAALENAVELRSEPSFSQQGKDDGVDDERVAILPQNFPVKSEEEQILFIALAIFNSIRTINGI